MFLYVYTHLYAHTIFATSLQCAASPMIVRDIFILEFLESKDDDDCCFHQLEVGLAYILFVLLVIAMFSGGRNLQSHND